jgi:hypothetical protein
MATKFTERAGETCQKCGLGRDCPARYISDLMLWLRTSRSVLLRPWGQLRHLRSSPRDSSRKTGKRR